jgi:protein-S-isoprenylcysteine O-methyltransferase Ste14
MKCAIIPVKLSDIFKLEDLTMSTFIQNQRTKRSFWAIGGIYALIALEFIYMATPFAVFFYSIYSPLLNFVNRYHSLAWLNSTFLPHIVRDTSSFWLNLRQPVGIALFLTGMTGFIIGVVQIYYSKLFRHREVTGGLYRFIRHPQYLFLMIWGLGLVLLWPRTIVLFSFLTMIFIYYRLARIEEIECERKFGVSYSQYKAETGMFIPRVLIPDIPFLKINFSTSKRHLLLTALYFITLLSGFIFSVVIRNWSIDHLYAVYKTDAAYISITGLDDQTLQSIIDCALANPEVQRRLSATNESANIKYVNYILPAKLFMLEIPMNKPLATSGLHFLTSTTSEEKYKIIFCRAAIRGDRSVQGKEILKNVTGRTMVMEVSIDCIQKKILEIKEPPVQVVLGDITMPVY